MHARETYFCLKLRKICCNQFQVTSDMMKRFNVEMYDFKGVNCSSDLDEELRMIQHCPEII